MSDHEKALESDLGRAEEEKSALKSAIMALLGGPGFRTEYECGHGTPLGKKCFKDCRLNPVRAVLKHLPKA